MIALRHEGTIHLSAIPRAKQRLLKSENAFFFCYNCPVHEPLGSLYKPWYYLSPSIPGTSIPILPDGRIVLIRRRDNGMGAAWRG